MLQDGRRLLQQPSESSAVVTERDIKSMGRDTIAGLIAGILHKYSGGGGNGAKKEVSQTIVARSK